MPTTVHLVTETTVHPVTEDANALVAAAISLGPQIRASAAGIEEARRLPALLVEAIKAAGIFRMAMPAAWGGPESDPLTQFQVIEELSAADASVGWCAAIGLSGGYFSAFLDQEVAREMYSDLDAVTGYVVRPTGRAVAVPGGYSVSGRWALGSGCEYSAWMASGCIVHDGDAPRLGLDGRPEMLICYLPSGSFSVLDTWHSTGLRGTGSHDYTAKDAFVPAEQTFNIQNSPIRRDAPLYQTRRMFLFLHAAVALGLARSAVCALVDLVGNKQTLVGTPLREEAFIHSLVANAETLVRAARSYAIDVISDLWETLVAGDAPSPRQRAHYRLAIVHAHAASIQAVNLVYNAGGGSSIHASGPFDRLLRDVHTAAQHVVGSPRTYESAGRLLLGLDAGDPTF